MITKYFYEKLKQDTSQPIDVIQIDANHTGFILKDKDLLIAFNITKPIKSSCKNQFIVHENQEKPAENAFNYYLEKDTETEYIKCYNYFCKKYKFNNTISSVAKEKSPDNFEQKIKQIKDSKLKAIISWLEQTEFINLEQHEPELYQWLINNKDIFPIKYKYNNKHCLYFLPDKWGKQLNAYIKFTAFHPETDINKITYYDNINIKYWTTEQRTAYKEGYIKQERLDILKSIDFVFNTFDDDWLKAYDIYKQYITETHTVLIPKRDTYHDFNLGMWCETQRKQYKADKLTPEKIDKLNNIGFIWDVLEYEWQQNLQLYKEYIEEHQTTNISKRTIYKDKKLGVWVHLQKRTYKENKISQERIQKLLKLNPDIFSQTS